MVFVSAEVEGSNSALMIPDLIVSMMYVSSGTGDSSVASAAYTPQDALLGGYTKNFSRCLLGDIG
jgi:hypothetical protein